MPTIGVSLAVPSPYAAHLQARRASYGDPLAYAIPTHITLLPPTLVPDAALPDVARHLGAVAERHEPFEVVLKGTDTFRPVSPVVFVRVAAGMSACAALESDVRRGPLDRAVEFAYHPHVTVAHHVPDTELDRALSELAGFECEFVVDELHLYEHGPDGVWRQVRSFGFDGHDGHPAMRH